MFVLSAFSDLTLSFEYQKGIQLENSQMVSSVYHLGPA